MAKGKLPPIPISAGYSSELDKAFRKIQEIFRADPSLGSFSAFVKQATVEAWRRRGREESNRRDDTAEDLRAEIAELRRELMALRAKLAERQEGGSPASPLGRPDEAQAAEALQALEQLAKMF